MVLATAMFVSDYAVRELLLAVYFVGYSELLAALCAAGCENATTISGLHALTETVLVVALAVVGLECSFHFAFISI